ncbi:MAG: hypothetical protein RSD08_08200 [Oscillospiraceae bacterium]
MNSCYQQLLNRIIVFLLHPKVVSRNHNATSIRWLLEHGADAKGNVAHSETSLFLFASYMHRDFGTTEGFRLVVRAFLDAGALPSTTGWMGNTLLHDIKFDGPHDAFLLQWLVAQGFDLNARNTEGDTPFLCCIQACDYRSALAFFRAGADICAENTWGNNWEHLVCETHAKTIAKHVYANDPLTRQMNKQCNTLIQSLIDWNKLVHALLCSHKNKPGILEPMIFHTTKDYGSQLKAVLKQGQSISLLCSSEQQAAYVKALFAAATAENAPLPLLAGELKNILAAFPTVTQVGKIPTEMETSPEQYNAFRSAGAIVLFAGECCVLSKLEAKFRSIVSSTKKQTAILFSICCENFMEDNCLRFVLLC